MSHYQIIIPQDILSLFFSVIKKERIHRSLTVAPAVVTAHTQDGSVSYAHNVELPASCTFEIPIDPAIVPTSDLCIEWDFVTDSNGINAKNARLVFSDCSFPIERPRLISPIASPSFTPQPLHRDLAAAIPQLSKCACKERWLAKTGQGNKL